MSASSPADDIQKARNKVLSIIALLCKYDMGNISQDNEEKY